MIPKMAQGTHFSPPFSILMINNSKEQHFSKMVGGEVASKTDNNAQYIFFN